MKAEAMVTSAFCLVFFIPSLSAAPASGGHEERGRGEGD